MLFEVEWEVYKMKNFIVLSVLLVSLGAIALIILSLSGNNGISDQLGEQYPKYQRATKTKILGTRATVQFQPAAIQLPQPLVIALVNQ